MLCFDTEGNLRNLRSASLSFASTPLLLELFACATFARLLKMAQEPASLKPVEDLADDIFHLLELSGQNTIFIDQQGDLDLVVGTGEVARTFCVSSKVMRLASPVWRAMLSPDFSFIEAGNDTSQITFPEDNPTALFILLLASHLRLLEIPKFIDDNTLMELCILCDKYDCVAVLRPWLSVWLPPLSEILRETAPPLEWAMISWVIGDASGFKIATNELVRWCTVDDSHGHLKYLGLSLEEKLPYGLSDQ